MGVQRSQAMYREEEKLCLKWNDFQENAISAFGTLREDREFTDVTLACEDGRQVEAHKVILASSSPFFLNLLRRNKHSHPLIYMRGLKSEELLVMMDFLYFGEANVYQDNLDSFLAEADELQLKGFMGSGAKDEVEESSNKPLLKNNTTKPQDQRKCSQQETTTPKKQSSTLVETSPPLEGTVAVTDYTVAADLQDLDDKIKSMIKVSEQKNDGDRKGFKRICKVCGKEGGQFLIVQHIEAHHITGVSHNCNICGKITRSRATMKIHKRRKHTTN